MPPKKKDSKKSLKLVPASEDNPSQSIETFPIQKYSIPRKPIYKAIRCTTDTRARLIRAKLWKAHSLHFYDPNESMPMLGPNNPDINPSNAKTRFPEDRISFSF